MDSNQGTSSSASVSPTLFVAPGDPTAEDVYGFLAEEEHTTVDDVAFAFACTPTWAEKCLKALMHLGLAKKQNLPSGGERYNVVLVS